HTILGMRKISPDQELTPATVIPQRPLSQATVHWNCVRRTVLHTTYCDFFTIYPCTGELWAL
ncbi:hypothetical protein ACSELK_005475, partial [Escherichia coli]